MVYRKIFFATQKLRKIIFYHYGNSGKYFCTFVVFFASLHVSQALYCQFNFLISSDHLNFASSRSSHNIHFKKFKAVWTLSDKCQDITTLTFESNFWLQEKVANACEDLQDILTREKERSKLLLIRDDYKECAK